MRVTAADLMMGGWHKMGKLWAFRHNPDKETGLTFHEAVRAYKGGMRDKE